MKDRLARIGAWLGRTYDRLLALLALIILMASVALYVIDGKRQVRANMEFEHWLRELSPRWPVADRVDMTAFRDAAERHVSPPEIGAAGPRLIVPELRHTCHDCRRPMPFDAKACPFCGAVPPTPPINRDIDQDQMFDDWEVEHKLDPRDASDAAHDPDKDGFANLEEFTADPRTDPQEAGSHPSVVGKLKLTKIEGVPLRLRFLAAIDMGNGDWKFQINDERGNTYYVALGDMVLGFKVSKFTQKSEKRNSGGVDLNADVSELELVKGNELFVLVKDQERSHFIFFATIQFLIDGSEYPRLRSGQEFKLKDTSPYGGSIFKLKSIDSEKQSILIEDPITGRESRLSLSPK